MEIELEVGSPSSVELEVGSLSSAEWGGAEYIPMTHKSITDYEQLDNLPSIEGVTLIGNHTQEELGIRPIGNAKILALFQE